MNLITLKAHHLIARKERNAPQAAVLGRVIGDIETQVKNRPGADHGALVTGVLADQLTAMLRERDQLASLGRNTAGADAELAVLQALDTEARQERARLDAGRLARQLSPEALEAAIREAVEGGATNIGAVMQRLKEQHDGNYGGRLASETARQVLAER